MVEKIDLEIQIPSGFPEKYRDSLIRSAELCAVKKHLENPPKFDITTKLAELETLIITRKIRNCVTLSQTEFIEAPILMGRLSIKRR